MDKIPVGSTMGHAFRFAFREFPTVIGLSWVSFVAIAGVIYLAMPPVSAAVIAAIQTHSGAPLLGALPWLGLQWVVLLAGFVMIILGITRQALGLRTGPAFIYFSADPVYFRLLGKYFILALCWIAVELAVGFGIAAISYGVWLTWGSGIAFRLTVTTGIMVLTAGVVYFALRVTFALPPAVVAEQHSGFLRAWQLSRGNFWRILGMFVLVMAIISAFEFIGEIVSFVVTFPTLPGAHPTVQQAAVYRAQLQAMGQDIGLVMLFVMVIAIVFEVVMTTAISAFAYRALVPDAQTGAANPA